MPEDVAQIFSEVWGKKRKIAKLKRKHISFITLSRKIDGIRWSVRIEFAKIGLEEYSKYLRRTF